MLGRIAAALVFIVPAVTAAAPAHPLFGLAHASNVRGATLPLRIGTTLLHGRFSPPLSSQPHLHAQKIEPEPAPAASPEFNPLRRRRMAMPNVVPGTDSDFAF